MPEICVNINISAGDILQYYKGMATTVSARALDGRNVQFPAKLLRPFMTYSGVCGRFIITYDTHGKFQDIRQEMDK